MRIFSLTEIAKGVPVRADFENIFAGVNRMLLDSPDVVEVRVFGSSVTKDWKETSDFDYLIIFRDDAWRDMLALGRRIKAFTDAANIPINLNCITKRDIACGNHWLQPQFWNGIIASHLVIKSPPFTLTMRANEPKNDVEQYLQYRRLTLQNLVFLAETDLILRPRDLEIIITVIGHASKKCDGFGRMHPFFQEAEFLKKEYLNELTHQAHERNDARYADVLKKIARFSEQALSFLEFLVSERFPR